MNTAQWHISTASFDGTCPVCSCRIRARKTQIAHLATPRVTVCENCYSTATAPTDGPDAQDWEREIRAKRAGQLAAAIAAAETSAPAAERSGAGLRPRAARPRDGRRPRRA